MIMTQILRMCLRGKEKLGTYLSLELMKIFLLTFHNLPHSTFPCNIELHSICHTHFQRIWFWIKKSYTLFIDYFQTILFKFSSSGQILCEYQFY